MTCACAVMCLCAMFPGRCSPVCKAQLIARSRPLNQLICSLSPVRLLVLPKSKPFTFCDFSSRNRSLAAQSRRRALADGISLNSRTRRGQYRSMQLLRLFWRKQGVKSTRLHSSDNCSERMQTTRADGTKRTRLLSPDNRIASTEQRAHTATRKFMGSYVATPTPPVLRTIVTQEVACTWSAQDTGSKRLHTSTERKIAEGLKWRQSRTMNGAVKGRWSLQSMAVAHGGGVPRG